MATGSYGIGGGTISGLADYSGSAVMLGGAYGIDAPKVPRGPVRIVEALVTRTVQLTLSDAPYSEVSATDEVDTGIVNVTIGCQTHPLARWRRLGERLIRKQYGDEEAKRLAPHLTMVLDRIAKEFARKR